MRVAFHSIGKLRAAGCEQLSRVGADRRAASDRCASASSAKASVTPVACGAVKSSQVKSSYGGVGNARSPVSEIRVAHETLRQSYITPAHPPAVMPGDM